MCAHTPNARLRRERFKAVSSVPGLLSGNLDVSVPLRHRLRFFHSSSRSRIPDHAPSLIMHPIHVLLVRNNGKHEEK